MLTWIGPDGSRMESARVQLTGNRLKVTGRLIVRATDSKEAFGASYDLVTDDAGVSKRLSINLTTASHGDRQLSLSLDSQGYWLIGGGEEPERSQLGGALDVDMISSPLFNTLAIRRAGVLETTETIVLPVAYVWPLSGRVESVEISYRNVGDGTVEVSSPVGTNLVTVDSDGFIIDYPGLATRR
nr:putative glycolipid-binding domain-containing protein [Millisia brevis]